jgi:outer membrane protein assembly factor BamA
MISMKSVGFTILFFLLVKDTRGQQDTASKEKGVSIAGIPILNYNGSYGVVVGLNTMAFFNINKKDTISPPSQLGLGGGFSENKSWYASLFGQFYFKEDKWRITTALGFGKINFQYFESFNESDEGDFVDYNSVNRFAMFRVLRKIKGPFYVGPILKFQHSKTDFEAYPDSTQEIDADGIGGSLLFDTRDYIYHPSHGWFATASFLANPAWMGSDSVFNLLRFFANYYFRINSNSILASRLSLFTGLGDVPFSAQRAVGGKDIRGYTNGKYRGNQVYTLQTEYRWNFYKRWGAVGFVGMAFTGHPSSGTLPGGGIGVRFMAIRSMKINIGVDGALGKNDAGVYFRINEAF